MTSFSGFSSLLDDKRGSSAPPPMERTVIVIDDDPSIRESLAFLLGDNYKIAVFASALDGVAAIHEDVYAVILDVKMPGYDGFWACTEIRKKVPDMPVIFYSAYQNLKDPYAVINDHRPFGYVAKGVDVQKLLDMLDAAVELQAAIVTNRKLLRNLTETTKQVH